MKTFRSVLGSAAVVCLAVLAGTTITWATQSSATTGTPTIHTVTTSQAITYGNNLSATASCSPGDKVTGGGYNLEGINISALSQIYVVYSVPTNTPPKKNTGWTVDVYNDSADSLVDLYVYAQCLQRS